MFYLPGLCSHVELNIFHFILFIIFDNLKELNFISMNYGPNLLLKTRSAPFSAAIMVGLFIFPLEISGMIEATTHAFHRLQWRVIDHRPQHEDLSTDQLYTYRPYDYLMSWTCECGIGCICRCWSDCIRVFAIALALLCMPWMCVFGRTQVAFWWCA